jgi:hypothetical protein
MDRSKYLSSQERGNLLGNQVLTQLCSRPKRKVAVSRNQCSLEKADDSSLYQITAGDVRRLYTTVVILK